MATVRKVALFLSLFLIVLVVAVFAYSNPDSLTVDIGFTRFENVSVSLAFAVAFALGWVFGLLSAGLALLRMVGERRRLRRELRLAEAEVSSLRSLPLQNAN